jgi:hypothetical protein
MGLIGDLKGDFSANSLMVKVGESKDKKVMG